MIEYLIIAISFIITTITSQISNSILPILMPPTINGVGISVVGATLYGYPFPFITSIGPFLFVDWIGFIIDIIIISLIIWVVVSLYNKRR